MATYNFMRKERKVSELGTQPKLLKKNLSRTDLYSILRTMYGHVREICKHLSKNDQENTGSRLYSEVISAQENFACSYYHSIADDLKLERAFLLVGNLENIKFLIDMVFELNMLKLDPKHVKGLRNKIYETVAKLQTQIEKWHQWIMHKVQEQSE